MAFDNNYYELIFLHLSFLRNWATTSNNRMWWCKYLKILSQNIQVTECYNLFLGIIHAWALNRQQQGYFKKKLKKKMHIMVLIGSFCKLWQILRTNSIWRKGMCICDQKFISLSTKMFLVSVLKLSNEVSWKISKERCKEKQTVYAILFIEHYIHSLYQIMSVCSYRL